MRRVGLVLSVVRASVAATDEETPMDNIDVPCPECGKKVKCTLADIAKQRTIRCASGHSVKLVDEGKGAAKASKALKDLEKTLKNFGK